MSEIPKISIITVVYNAESFLEETINSVINQTYLNIEYIIIDGGSTDKTLDIIKKYEKHIDFWMSEKDQGIYDAMNKGILNATGDFLNFLNAGDSFVNNDVCSKIFIDEIIKNDLIYGPIALRDANLNFLTNVYPKEFNRFNLLFWGTGTLCHQAMFVNKRIMAPYSLDYTLKGELNWYFDLEKNLESYYIVEFPIVNYSLGGTGDINYKLNTQEGIKLTFKRNDILGLLSLPFIVYNFIRKIFK